jgi:hypothetical protein
MLAVSDARTKWSDTGSPQSYAQQDMNAIHCQAMHKPDGCFVHLLWVFSGCYGRALGCSLRHAFVNGGMSPWT